MPALYIPLPPLAGHGGVHVHLHGVEVGDVDVGVVVVVLVVVVVPVVVVTVQVVGHVHGRIHHRQDKAHETNGRQLKIVI